MLPVGGWQLLLRLYSEDQARGGIRRLLTGKPPDFLTKSPANP